MRGKAIKQQKPEDMLLRVIRVAEILTKSVDHKSDSKLLNIRDMRLQKNPDASFCCKVNPDES